MDTSGTNFSDSLAELQQETHDVTQAISNLAKLATEPGILDSKTKALLTLMWAVQTQQPDCIQYHVHNALANDVTLDEMKELIAVAAYMGGGPGMMSAQKALSLYKSSIE